MHNARGAGAPHIAQLNLDFLIFRDNFLYSRNSRISVCNLFLQLPGWIVCLSPASVVVPCWIGFLCDSADSTDQFVFNWSFPRPRDWNCQFCDCRTTPPLMTNSKLGFLFLCVVNSKTGFCFEFQRKSALKCVSLQWINPPPWVPRVCSCFFSSWSEVFKIYCRGTFSSCYFQHHVKNYFPCFQSLLPQNNKLCFHVEPVFPRTSPSLWVHVQDVWQTRVFSV